MAKTYRLPDGTITRKESEHVKAWHEFAAPIERILPPFKLEAFNPDLYFTDTSTSSWRSFTLPVDVARQFIESIAKLEQAACAANEAPRTDGSVLVWQDDLYSFLHSALRYAVGRRTYITGVVADEVRRYWGTLLPNQKYMLTMNLRQGVEDYDRMGQKIGDDCDDKGWRTLLAWMEERAPKEMT